VSAAAYCQYHIVNLLPMLPPQLLPLAVVAAALWVLIVLVAMPVFVTYD
jgi:hypothetical protein